MEFPAEGQLAAFLFRDHTMYSCGPLDYVVTGKIAKLTREWVNIISSSPRIIGADTPERFTILRNDIIRAWELVPSDAMPRAGRYVEVRWLRHFDGQVTADEQITYGLLVSKGRKALTVAYWHYAKWPRKVDTNTEFAVIPRSAVRAIITLARRRRKWPERQSPPS